MSARPRVAVRLIRAALRHRREARLTVFGFLALSSSQLSLTWAVKLWIDGPLSHPQAAASPWLLPATGLLLAALSLSVFVAHRGLGVLNASVIADLRRDLQGHLLDLEVGAVQGKPLGDLVSRVLQDADVAGRFGGEILRRGLGDLLVFLGALTMLLVIDRQLFGLIVLVAPIGVLAHSLVAWAIRARSLSAQSRLGQLAARFAEQMSGFTTIKGYRTETLERRRFAADNELHLVEAFGVERWSAFSLASIWLVTGVATLGLGFYASRALLAGRLAPGDFLVFCLFGAQIIEPVRRLGELGTLAQRGVAAGQRIYEVLDQAQVERNDGRAVPQPVRGEVRFDQVRFAYRPEHLVLDGATFAIAARETVAIVSPSGGGKSTIAALLARFYEPASGAVILDGNDIASLRVGELRQSVRVVSQEPFVFSGTLLDNLCYGRDDVTPSAIDEAVHRAGLEAWVGTLPLALQTRLEEAGRNLSGGQKQRIALARAILADPAVIVLDEATSAVDSDTEEQVMARMQSWLEQRTAIFMAHRLSTVLRVPRVLVLEAGRIVEDGAPLELLHRQSGFARIFRDQIVVGT